MERFVGPEHNWFCFLIFFLILSLLLSLYRSRYLFVYFFSLSIYIYLYLVLDSPPSSSSTIRSMASLPRLFDMEITRHEYALVFVIPHDGEVLPSWDMSVHWNMGVSS